MRKLLTVLAALATLSLTNCGYNEIQTNDEQVKSSWSEVVNQYQRRADLVPNLVNSVKGFAQQEKDVLIGVTNARAKVGSVQATPEVLNDPAAFQKIAPPITQFSFAMLSKMPLIGPRSWMTSCAARRGTSARLCSCARKTTSWSYRSECRSSASGARSTSTMRRAWTRSAKSSKA